ncbi:MAG: hypothetical protein ACP5G6_08935 [Conexivisphaera sp.]
MRIVFPLDMGAGAREHYRKLYREIFPGGERLNELKKVVDWEAFRPILEGLFKDSEVGVGRPHVDVVLMAKMLVLQAWYSLPSPGRS